MIKDYVRSEDRLSWLTPKKRKTKVYVGIATYIFYFTTILIYGRSFSWH
jgi:hypothetical protein